VKDNAARSDAWEKKKKHNLFYLAEEMLEEQPGEPTSLICKPGKESSDKMETRAGGKA